MAFTEAEVEEFIAALQRDPHLRDRVRDAILADDFLALPGIVRQLGERLDRLAERMDQLAERMDQLAERMDQLTERMDQLTARMDQLAVRMDELVARMDQLTERMDELVARMDQLTARMDELAERMDQLTARMDQLVVRLEKVEGRLEKVEGRLGNVEGELYEVKFQQNLGAHLGVRYRNIRPLTLANYEPLLGILDAGRLSEEEWADLTRADVTLLAAPRGAPGTEILVVVELSRTVDLGDVVRSHRRARILQALGFAAEACVSGHGILAEAAAHAGELGVAVVVDREEEAA